MNYQMMIYEIEPVVNKNQIFDTLGYIFILFYFIFSICV